MGTPAQPRRQLGRFVSGDESDVPQITTAGDWHVGFAPGPGDDPAVEPATGGDIRLFADGKEIGTGGCMRAARTGLADLRTPQGAPHRYGGTCRADIALGAEWRCVVVILIAACCWWFPS